MLFIYLLVAVSPQATSTPIFRFPVVPWAPYFVVCRQSRFTFVTIILSKRIQHCHPNLDALDVYFLVHLSHPEHVLALHKCDTIYKFIMPKSNLFVAGSIHQGHEQFSDISQFSDIVLF